MSPFSPYVAQHLYVSASVTVQSINQSIPLFKCQTNIAVEEPLNGDTMSQKATIVAIIKIELIN